MMLIDLLFLFVAAFPAILLAQDLGRLTLSQIRSRPPH